MEVQVIEVNGERYVNLKHVIQAIAATREHSTTRREALESIMENLMFCSVIELPETIELAQ